MEDLLNEFRIKRVSEIKRYHLENNNDINSYPSLPSDNSGPSSGQIGGSNSNNNNGNVAIPLPASNTNMSSPSKNNNNSNNMIPEPPPLSSGYGPMLPPANVNNNNN